MRKRKVLARALGVERAVVLGLDERDGTFVLRSVFGGSTSGAVGSAKRSAGATTPATSCGAGEATTSA